MSNVRTGDITLSMQPTSTNSDNETFNGCNATNQSISKKSASFNSFSLLGECEELNSFELNEISRLRVHNVLTAHLAF
jgi:hypothetical protein